MYVCMCIYIYLVYQSSPVSALLPSRTMRYASNEAPINAVNALTGKITGEITVLVTRSDPGSNTALIRPDIGITNLKSDMVTR